MKRRLRGKRFCAGLIMILGIMMCRSALGFDVDLKVKLSTVNNEREYLKGMPIVLRMHIVNEDAIRQYNWEGNEKAFGREVTHKKITAKITTLDRNWYENVSFEVNKITRSDDKIIGRENIGDLCLRANRMGCGFVQHRTELVDIQTVRDKWCITPEVTSSLPPGEYEAKAIFDNISLSGNSDIYTGKFVSNAVSIVIKEPITTDDKIKLYQALAGYYETNQIYDKVMLYASKALELGDQGAHGGIGTAYLKKGNLAKAIEHYELYIAYRRSLPPVGEDSNIGIRELEKKVESWKKKLETQ